MPDTAILDVDGRAAHGQEFGGLIGEVAPFPDDELLDHGRDRSAA